MGYKYEDLVLQVGRVSNETVKYSCEFSWTSTQGSLLWQGPEAIVQVNYKSSLSSERVPHIKKPAICRQKTKIPFISSFHIIACVGSIYKSWFWFDTWILFTSFLITLNNKWQLSVIRSLTRHIVSSSFWSRSRTTFTFRLRPLLKYWSSNLILWPTVGRPVRLGALPLLEQVTRCYISLSDNYFLYFLCRAPSLTRGGGL
jgi:hypothetical protein